MRRLSILTLLSLAGCSSGNESLPVYVDTGSPLEDGGQDVINDRTLLDGSDVADIFDAPAFDFGIYDTGPNCAETSLPKVYVSNDISLVKSVNVPYTSNYDAGYGGLISEVAVIQDVLNTGALPYDPQGLYILSSSKEVQEDGFCFQWCGYHESAVMTQGLTRYVVLPSMSACANCNPFSVSNALAMTNVLAHEIAEAATDPDPTLSPAWQDAFFNAECGDKCNWIDGLAYQGTNYPFNVQLGSHQYLIQELWALNSDGGATNHCGLDVNGNPGFDVAEAGKPIILDAGWVPETLPMVYRGGPVLNSPVRVYYIFLGAWNEPDAANTKLVLEQFANDIGGSNWWQQATEYFSVPGCFGDSGVPDGGDAGVPEASSD